MRHVIMTVKPVKAKTVPWVKQTSHLPRAPHRQWPQRRREKKRQLHTLCLLPQIAVRFLATHSCAHGGRRVGQQHSIWRHSVCPLSPSPAPRSFSVHLVDTSLTAQTLLLLLLRSSSPSSTPYSFLGAPGPNSGEVGGRLAPHVEGSGHGGAVGLRVRVRLREIAPIRIRHL